MTAIEALIVPRPEWRKEKTTKRFIEMTIQLCPDVVDSLVNHQNVEQAFGYQKRGSSVNRLRKDLLDRVYTSVLPRPTPELVSQG